MPHDFDHNTFEEWLRNETDKHRLYPDESVWQRIQQRVHRRRWFPFVLTALLTISASVTWVMIDQPDLPLNYAYQTKENKKINKSLKNKTTSISLPNEQAPYRSIENRSEGQLTFLLQANETSLHASASSNEMDPASTNANTEWIAATNASEKKSWSNSSEQTKIIETHTNIDLSTNDIVSDEAAQLKNKEESIPVNADEATKPLLPEQYQSIESVINAYKGKRTRKSWRLQFSVSPTISYRQLIENTSALQAARSIVAPAPAIAVPELATAVNHKPDLGLQIGLSVNRQLSKRFDFVGGLQFNINKYDIRAYRGTREVATVGLTNEGAMGTVSSYTYYRSSGGVWGKWLANFYLSASAPIGLQYRVVGNKKWNWWVGSTLQPTYILSNQTYLLSTDYKNYMEVPSLVRRWNMNGQFETFIGFQKGKTRWTLGPQARYQLLSSYEKAYPVREHLFDVGIKLGIGL